LLQIHALTSYLLFEHVFDKAVQALQTQTYTAPASDMIGSDVCLIFFTESGKVYEQIPFSAIAP